MSGSGRNLLCFGLALLGTWAVETAAAQQAPRPANRTVGAVATNPALGMQCLMPQRSVQGVVKLDLCGRSYCGSPRFQEPFQMRDYDQRRLPCTFRVVANQCRCVPE